MTTKPQKPTKPKKAKKQTEHRLDSNSYAYSLFDDPTYDFDGDDLEEMKFTHARRRIDALSLD